MSSTPRRRLLTIRLTMEEAADLAARAAEERRTVADYVRERVGLQVREVRVPAPARLTLEGR